MTRLIFNSSATKGSLYSDRIRQNLPLLITLAILLIISLVWIFVLFRWKNNTRVKGQVKENISIEMAAFLATYIVPIVFIDINWLSLIINIVLFIAAGIAIIVSDKHFMNPTFFLFYYKLYRLGDNCILYRGSMDKLNIAIAENPNGICARELVRNTYIVLPR
jgi:hypothetical protein